uniref:Putative LOV domain-containing protein n=1 Tax=Lindsaea microphylla TaxID=641181 RepID=A0A126X434_9MONI|nr:putative LOV domain-containing protein [Lindsaea microphylla]
MGRNPKFLKGPDTDRRSMLLIRDSICEEKTCSVTVLNYTKQGRPFWIVFQMAPVFSKNNGKLMHFVGAQVPLERLVSRQWKKSCGKDQLMKGTYLCQSCDDQSKEMEGASKIVELVTNELTVLRDAKKALCSRPLSENAETASLTTLCSSLTLALTRIQQSFVIVNPKFSGTPIVFASGMFLHLTGYQKDEVMGRNCRFLQGEATDMAVIQEVRDCVKAETACTVRLINYRKDKVAFWNLLHVGPIRDHTGKVAYFVGVQVDLGLAEGGCCQASGVSPAMQQLGAVGVVKVAVRSLQSCGLRRDLGHSGC